MRFMLRLFEKWRTARRWRRIAHEVPAGDLAVIGRPYLITPKQTLHVYRLICRGEVSVSEVEAQLGIDRAALARGFERRGLALPWLDDTPPAGGTGVH